MPSPPLPPTKAVMLQSHGTNGARKQLWIMLLEKTSIVALWLEIGMVMTPGICLPLALACPLGLLAHVKVQLVQPWLNTVQDYCLSIPKHTDWQKLAAVNFKATNSCSSDQGMGDQWVTRSGIAASNPSLTDNYMHRHHKTKDLPPLKP